MRRIKIDETTKENALGRHYTPKSPETTTQALDPIHPPRRKYPSTIH
jgi:hypothetical protein